MGTPQQTFGSTDEYLIRSIPDDFMHYHHARNINKLMSLFADDGRIMGPFRPSTQGRTGLRKALELGFKQYDQKNLKLATIYVEVSGHVAFGFGTYEVSVMLPTGRRIDDHGKWLVTLRRIATVWKIVAQCWNTDLPLTAFIQRKSARAMKFVQ